jgi:hypothetical protein
MRFKIGDTVILNKSGISSAVDFLYDIIHDGLGFESLASHIEAALPGKIIDVLPDEGAEGEDAYIVSLQINIPIAFDNLTFEDEMELV